MKEKSSWRTTKKINYNKTFPSFIINIWLLINCALLMVVVFSEYLSPLWGFILLGWYIIISSPLGLSVAVIYRLYCCLLFPYWLSCLMYCRAVGVLCRCPLFVVSLLLLTLVVTCYLSKYKYQPFYKQITHVNKIVCACLYSSLGVCVYSLVLLKV